MNDLKKDLVFFVDLVRTFLKEEKKQPITKVIPPKEVGHRIDVKLNEHATKEEEFQIILKKLILNSPKSATKLFYNQLYGGRQSKALIGDFLSALLNNSMATYKIAGPQVNIEKEVLDNIISLTNFGKKASGTFPTGGSMSNFMSLIMARDKFSPSSIKKGVEKKLIVYTSVNSHYSVSKNVSFSGVGRDNIRYIGTNNKGQIDVKLLKSQIKKDIKNRLKPFYLNATAGTTVLCAFDSIEKLIPICKKYDIWLHVDGAFGGTAMFSKKYSKLLKGVGQADSFCFNAHKTLGAPISTSVLIVKNKEHLNRSFNNEASYLYQTHDNDYNLGQTSFECGRRNNALKFWCLWKSLGKNGIEKIVDKNFYLADFARKYIKSNKNYKLYSFENTLSACFNYKNFDPVDLCTKLYEKNKLMVGFGKFKKTTFVRLVTINSENTEDDIINFFKVLEKFTLENSELVKKISSDEE